MSKTVYRIARMRHTTSTEAQSLSSLCSWWKASKDETIPGICHWFTEQSARQGSSSYPDVGMAVMEHSSNSSISILFILAGVFFILLVMAVTIWISKKKRRDKIEKTKTKDEPPEYIAALEMIKTEDDNLPTYAEAILIESPDEYVKKN